MSTAFLQFIPVSTLTTTAEGIAIGTGAMSIGPGTNGIWFSGGVSITPGTGSTALNIRLRAGLTGTLADPIVDSTGTIAVAANVHAYIGFNLIDIRDIAPPAGPGEFYTITVQMTGATANTTVNGGQLGVEVL